MLFYTVAALQCWNCEVAIAWFLLILLVNKELNSEAWSFIFYIFFLKKRHFEGAKEGKAGPKWSCGYRHSSG